MPRKKNLDPSIDLHIKLPPNVVKQMEAYLHSDLEGTVPFGSRQKFLTELITGFFQGESLDLSQYAPAAMMIPPGLSIVRGTSMAISQLRALLTPSEPLS